MSLRTIAGALAVLDSEANAAPPSPIDNGFAVVVSPAASLGPARAGRTIAPGSFPVWLVQTDNRGSERCRVLVQSSAPLYFAKGTGDRWRLAAVTSSAALSDLAFDVTIGDDPGDWLETVSPAQTSWKEEIQQSIINPNFATVPTTFRFVRPTFARALAIRTFNPGPTSVTPAANIRYEDATGATWSPNVGGVTYNFATAEWHCISIGIPGPPASGMNAPTWDGLAVPTAVSLVFASGTLTGGARLTFRGYWT